MNFYTALELLETARNKSAGKPIGRNTRLIWVDDHTIGLTLHDNIIVYYHDDMSITLDSCGWQTVTTKDRLNNFTPFSIYQRSRQWYVQADDKEFLFKDGMKLYQTACGWATENAMTENEYNETKQLEKKIDKFADKFADTLPVNLPSGGDCWYCVMGNENGETMGDLSGDHDHLMSHIEEEYFVPALLMNAVREAGWTDFGIQMSGIFNYTNPDVNKWRRTQAKRALKNYMITRLIQKRKVVA